MFYQAAGKPVTQDCKYVETSVARERALGVVVVESVGNDVYSPPYLDFGNICSEAMQDLAKLLFVDGPSPLQVKCLHKKRGQSRRVSG